MNDEKDLKRLWEEVRGKETQKPKGNGAAGSSFEPLPDGKYNGRVFIEVQSVSKPESPNFGRTKYVIELTVTEGELRGRMAYHNRVLFPASLGNKPPESEKDALHRWEVNARNYIKKTDEILANCGVDVSEINVEDFVRKLAENNRRRPLVNFSVRNGNTYINRLIKREVAATGDELFENLPDGNDAPIQ